MCYWFDEQRKTEYPFTKREEGIREKKFLFWRVAQGEKWDSLLFFLSKQARAEKPRLRQCGLAINFWPGAICRMPLRRRKWSIRHNINFWAWWTGKVIGAGRSLGATFWLECSKLNHQIRDSSVIRWNFSSRPDGRWRCCKRRWTILHNTLSTFFYKRECQGFQCNMDICGFSGVGEGVEVEGLICFFTCFKAS